MRPTILLLLLATIAAAQDMPRFNRWEGVWGISVVGLGVSKGFDIATTRSSISRGARETNPLFGSSPTTKDYVISASVIVGIALVQRKIVKDHPHSGAARKFAFMNGVIAGVTLGVALSNSGNGSNQ